jgi:hypothetical protein
MHRREFITNLLVGVPVVGAVVTLVGCGDSRLLAQTQSTRKIDLAAIQSFGYYEPLGETDQHDQSETDGTNYNMPCISVADIQAGVDKTYQFWHDHGGVFHMFTVTAAMFKQLQQGQAVLAYTTMVEDHRHSAQITPGTACQKAACPT